MKPTRILAKEFSVNEWGIIIDAGDTLEDMLQPEYWSSIAANFREGHLIYAREEAGAYFAMLYVVSAGRLEAAMDPIIYKEFGAKTELASEESPYEVKYRGPNRKFSVVRRSDGGVMIDELQTKDHAQQWLKNHIASLSH